MVSAVNAMKRLRRVLLRQSAPQRILLQHFQMGKRIFLEELVDLDGALEDGSQIAQFTVDGLRSDLPASSRDVFPGQTPADVSYGSVHRVLKAVTKVPAVKTPK
jgi:hypothetical protein